MAGNAQDPLHPGQVPQRRLQNVFWSILDRPTHVHTLAAAASPIAAGTGLNGGWTAEHGCVGADDPCRKHTLPRQPTRNSSIGGTRVAAFMQGIIEDHSNSTKGTTGLLPSCNGTSEGCSNRAKSTTGLPPSYNGALNGCRNPTMSNTGLLHWYN